MINSHLHILHLFPTTGHPKTDQVAQQRYDNLMIELDTQGITDYSIIEGFYDPVNTKQAIHKGHRRIVQLAKEQGLTECFIAEDDIKFSSSHSFKYFISQIPKSYDLFSALVYSAEMEGNRVRNGASGIMSLYVISSRFYDFFLSMDINNHVDRECGLTAYKHEYYVCQPMCVTQRGGFSMNLKMDMWYDTYLIGKKMYGVDQ
jgi:hypothetical protein